MNFRSCASLFEHAGSIVARDDMMKEELWNSDFFVMTIPCLSMWPRLRKKLEEAGLSKLHRNQERHRLRVDP